MEIEKIVKNLIDTFLVAGDLSLSLRKKGLKKKLNLITLQLATVTWKLTSSLLKKFQR